MADAQYSPLGLTSLESARHVVAAHGARLLGHPGVVAVRPGFRVVAGELTEEPAVVVATQPQAGPAAAAPLPERLDGVPVQMLPASPLELLQGAPRVDSWEWLAQPTALEATPEIGYEPPSDARLERVKVAGPVVCHVCPDVGWATLEPFLQKAEQRLTVAMFDFYAEHIISFFERLAVDKPAMKLELILQVDPQKEDAIVSRLEDAWGERLTLAPAVVSGPHRVFANSYHTKVAVRDGTAFWLSSGNWTPTSQPLIPPGPQPTLYNRGNREWHAIVEDADLAATFEAFIRHDIAQAQAAAAESVPEAALEMPDLFVTESALEPEAAFVQEHPFLARSFPEDAKPLDIEPLMTPDNYTTRIRELIEDAKVSLYLQYAYIHMAKELDGYRAIIDAVTKKIRDKLDVRIIVGSNQTAEHTQALQALGWTLGKHLRMQRSKLHNKGVLVDSKVALVGSQNWSKDGTQYNRDATLVFHDESVVKYFKEVFLFDWDNLTRSPLLPEMQPMIATEGEPPPGMIRVSWAEWFED